MFAGNKENYVFSVAADGTLTVTDTNTSQGVDTVSGVETLRFDDGDLSVATAEDGHVTLTGSDADDVIVIGGAAESQILDEGEPNNSFESATFVSRAAFASGTNPDVEDDSLPWASISALLNPENDYDYYEVELQAGETITADTVSYTHLTLPTIYSV